MMIDRQSRLFRANEVIFREGDVGDCAYLIEKGSVLIFLNKDGAEYPLKVLGKGEVFGEMSLFSRTRNASVVAGERGCEVAECGHPPFADHALGFFCDDAQHSVDLAAVVQERTV